MEKLTAIIVRLALEGIHRWEAAAEAEPEVSFLSFPHRHIFHFEVKKMVEHDDRDIEIILFKREIQDYFNARYGSPCDFDKMSCEMLATEIAERFDCFSVRCLEDNENGAEIIRMI